MIYPLTCPGCHARLRVRADDPGQTFTCPRCLTPVSAAAHGSGPEEPAAVPMARYHLAPADVDVGRDRKIMAFGLLVLLLLGAAAIFLTYQAGINVNRPGEVSGNFALGATAAGGLFIIAATGLLIDTFVRRWQTGGAGRVVLAVLLSIVVTLTVPAALFILFFFSCLAGMDKRG